VPSPTRCLTAEDVETLVRSHCSPTAAGDRVGIETEWVVRGPDPLARLTPDDLQPLLSGLEPLPGGSRVTFEPGGQVELSTPPAAGLEPALAAAAADAAALLAALERAGLRGVATALDTCRPPVRVVDAPRYEAMEAYFDRDGRAGRTMMCSTASVQVNLDLGADDDVVRARWQGIHTLGPTLAATFAASPFGCDGRPSGWRSTRLATWFAIDPTRTAPVGGDDPGRAWANYALRARVMLVRGGDGCEPVRGALPLRAWVDGGHDCGYPDTDDVLYHLTTLFPPVRPRQWIEVRFLDALPEPWRRAAVAVTTALVYDDEARARAATAAAAAPGWRTAARAGLAHPDLARAARIVLEAAVDALPRLHASAETKDAVAEFTDRFAARDRCPADDIEDAWPPLR
jgi:glutamate--cysteine ligase